MNAVNEALYDRLTGDAPLMALLGTRGVYHALAPQPTEHEFLVYGKQQAVDEYVQRTRAGRNLLYFVKMVGLGLSVVEAETIMEAVDTVLTDIPLTITGWTNTYIRRVADIEYAEEYNGRIYQHIGATWELEIV